MNVKPNLVLKFGSEIRMELLRLLKTSVHVEPSLLSANQRVHVNLPIWTGINNGKQLNNRNNS